MRPDGLLVVSYGGGVDSVALLVHLHQLDARPYAIVMADPGDEKLGTLAYLRDWTQPLLRRWGWPEVEVISRKAEGALRPPLPVSRGPRRLESLREECLRINALPSVAYGHKKCSQKYKGEPQRWWAQRQEWARSEWASGRKLVKAIGYDFDEPQRVTRAIAAWTKPAAAWESKRFSQWFPLIEARLTRAGCENLIREAGLPLPPKSSCKFCPNNTLAEWEELRRDDPQGFADALAMSRNADIDEPDVVGLMRCNKAGRRQLHDWADGKYEAVVESSPSPSCDCAT